MASLIMLRFQRSTPNYSRGKVMKSQLFVFACAALSGVCFGASVSTGAQTRALGCLASRQYDRDQ